MIFVEGLFHRQHRRFGSHRPAVRIRYDTAILETVAGRGADDFKFRRVIAYSACRYLPR